MSSHRLLLALLLGVGALLSSRAAEAQIVHENPAQVKAANRRALREAQRTDSPYKDSHLAVTPARLRRGESTRPRAERSDELDYETVTGPTAKPAGLLDLRRRKKPQALPAGTGKTME